MAKIKIGVVEDEAIIADTILITLSKLGYDTCSPCASYTEAVQMIESERPDLVMVDIQLSGKLSGIDLGKKIVEEFRIPFIYLTSNSDKATLDAAKQTSPDAFLVKPFNKDDLFTSIEVALFKAGNKQKADTVAEDASRIMNQAVFIKEGGNLVKIIFDDIHYLMSDHVYLEIFCDNNKRHVIRAKMEDFLEKLPSQFIQVHRRYAVNLNKVTSIGTDKLHLGKTEIPVSKSFRDQLLNAINHM